jgi:hypothetical protein
VRKLKGSKLLTCLMLSVAAQSAFAHIPLIPQSVYCGKFLFQIGGFYGHQGQSQHIGIVDLIGDRFTVTQQNDGNFLAGLGYYIQGFNYSNINFMYGLNAFYLAHTEVEGKVVQEDIFTNLGYHYNITNYPVYAVLKGVANPFGPNYAITFDVGLGANFMQTNSFKEYSLDGITIPDLVFGSTTTAVFSASLGLGVQFNNLLNHAGIELGYRFFYLGQGEFSKKNNQVLNNLKTGDTYANAFVATLSI